jgi:hypothetical protein
LSPVKLPLGVPHPFPRDASSPLRSPAVPRSLRSL